MAADDDMALTRQVEDELRSNAVDKRVNPRTIAQISAREINLLREMLEAPALLADCAK